MPLSINTNHASLSAQRAVANSQGDAAQSMERLATGLRINSAKDDASGIAVVSRLNSQIDGLNQATSWAHSNPQQANWGVQENSLPLKSEDDSWKLESRVADNDEGPRKSDGQRIERETEFRKEAGHQCVGWFRPCLYARLQQQKL